MIFSGYIFSIVIFPYYFLLHNVRIKRYFSPNLIPTNYSALCSSRNFIICLYIQHKSHSTDYSSKEWLSLFLSDTYGKYTRIFIFTQSFNRFLIISLDVLICRYSPLFRAFPALFISEEPHKSFYYPLCFRSQK